MFVYKNKEYKSKADAVRNLFDLGETSLNTKDKKILATNLNMTVQTVHATIMKHIGKTNHNPKNKIDLSVIQIQKKLDEKISKFKNSNKPIFINDQNPEIKSELMKNPNKIAVKWSPNQWGIPITQPPIYVIDENYDPMWTEPTDKHIEKSWN
jgi:hypothetical protein